MFGRTCFGALGIACLLLPFTGCSSSEIDAITVSPTVTDFEGPSGNVQLTAIATIGHGAHPSTYEDVTDLVTWSTPLPQVASANSSGYVTVVGLGLTSIKASTNGFTGVVSGTTTICAEPAGTANTSGITCPAVTGSFRPKTRLSLVRGQRAVGGPGEVVQFQVLGTSRDNGTQEDLTNSVKWSSSDDSVATVSSTGLVTGVGKGSATIMATLTNEDKTAVAAGANFFVGEPASR